MITVLLGVQIVLTTISVLSMSDVFVNLLIYFMFLCFSLQKDLEQKLAEIEKRRLVSILKQATQKLLYFTLSLSKEFYVFCSCCCCELVAFYVLRSACLHFYLGRKTEL